MGRRTRSVGIAGRFGARYGSTLRKRWRSVMERRYAPYECPRCGTKKIMKRISVGLWKCPKCGAIFAGGAYQPVTGVSKTVIAKEVRTWK